MKNIKFLCFIAILCGGLFFLLIIGCKKDRKQTNEIVSSVPNSSGTNGSKVGARTVESLELPAGSSAEVVRMFNDIQNADYVVGVTANPGFGGYCPSCLALTYLNGVTELTDDISIVIGDNVFTPDADGQFLVSNSSFASLYGSDVPVEIRSGATRLKSVTMHVPKIALVKKLTDNNIISRTGNNLSWIPDPDNALGKVILYYTLFDVGGNIITEDGELLDDNGSYSIDDIISNPHVKSIHFRLLTGNTTSTTLPNGKKLLFSIESYDHHRYEID